jgi:hypothetical protein
MTYRSSPASVLYIGGMGRSGSTLLQAMLGQLPGYVAAGEVRYLWERGLVDDVLCSCGRRFSACPFWLAVGERAFNGWDTVDANDVLALQTRVDRHRYLPGIVGPVRTHRFDGDLRRYGSMLARLVSAIAAEAGARVVVDSTKDPPHAFLLRSALGRNLRIVHLVRDSRGVAYSWTRTVRRPEVQDHEAYMETVAPATMALKWIDYNALFHALRLLGCSTAFLRYEDMVDAPIEALQKVARLTGIPLPDAQLPGADGRIELRPEHTLSGNPLRFGTGFLTIQADERWRHEMPARDRRTVLALTAPLLAAYGYVPRGRHSARAGRRHPEGL